MKKLIIGLTLLSSISVYANPPLATCKVLVSESESRDFILSKGNNAYIQIERLGEIEPQTGHRLDLHISMMNPVLSDGLIVAVSRHPIIFERDNQFSVVISPRNKNGLLSTGDDEEALRLSDCEIH